MTDDPEIHSYLSASNEVYLPPTLKKWVREQEYVKEAIAEMERTHESVTKQMKVVCEIKEKQEKLRPPGSVEKWHAREKCARTQKRSLADCVVRKFSPRTVGRQWNAWH